MTIAFRGRDPDRAPAVLCRRRLGGTEALALRLAWREDLSQVRG